MILHIGDFHVLTHDNGTDFLEGYTHALARLRNTVCLDLITDESIFDFVRLTINDHGMKQSFRAGMIAGYIAGLHMGPLVCLPSERRAAEVARKRLGQVHEEKNIEEIFC